MRGYCPKCREYRSDDGMDAWGIIWRDGRPTCERCGSYVDVWRNDSENCRKRLDNTSDVLDDNNGEQAAMRVREKRKKKRKKYEAENSDTVN